MRSSCHQIGRLSRGVLVIGILLITCSVVSNGSEGDRDYYFGQCNLACSADCSMQDAAKSPNERHPWRTWDLWITGWTCPENCMLQTRVRTMTLLLILILDLILIIRVFFRVFITDVSTRIRSFLSFPGRYKCMRQNMAFREHNNLPTVKVYLYIAVLHRCIVETHC